MSDNVYSKLAKARVMLQQKGLKKSGHNGYSNYDYFQLDDFVPSINEIFNELGLLDIFFIEEGYAYLQIVDNQANTQPIVFKSPIAESTIKGASPIQNLGGVITYMRRYLWLMAMEIVEQDAIDGLSPQQKETQKKISKNLLTYIRANATGEEIQKILDWGKVDKLENLTLEQGMKAVESIAKKAEINSDNETF